MIGFISSTIQTSGDNIFLHDPIGDASYINIGMFGSTIIDGTSGITLVMQDGFFRNMSLYENSIRKSDFGVRLLSTQPGRGHLEGFFLSDTVMRDVGTPLFVDTFWCPEGMTCHNSTAGGVLMDLITIVNLNGTHTSGIASEFRCDPQRKCGVNMYTVKLKESMARMNSSAGMSWAQPMAFFRTCAIELMWELLDSHVYGTLK